MKTLSVLSLIFLCFSLTLHAQRRGSTYGLPAGALIVETQPLATRRQADRALVLWMLNPHRNPRTAEPGEPYTCPEETRGSYYGGPTRVSLVNLKTGRVINTINVIEDYADDTSPENPPATPKAPLPGSAIDDTDTFDVPYRIHSGSYYHVPGVPMRREGKPQIMWLRDYNGDGKALEFALFEAEACMGLQTALFGYSERQDKVIQYWITLAVKGDKSSETRHSLWCDYLFSKTPATPGHWKYEIDYRGRAGSLDKYEIRYDARKEMFEGTYVWTREE
jgi:hypothetical protein